MKTLFRTFLVLSSSWIVACQHGGIVLSDTPLTLGETRRIIVGVIGEPRLVNRDGYELVSKFFDRKEKPIEKPLEVRERLSTFVTIIGDRRPYDLRIQVIIEGRTQDGYEPLGEDLKIAQKVADKIKVSLHESREKRNMIDDFKAF